MSDSDYAEQIEEQAAATPIDDAFYVAQIDQWDIADFEDIL
jgi:hypothetical protein